MGNVFLPVLRVLSPPPESVCLVIPTVPPVQLVVHLVNAHPVHLVDPSYLMGDASPPAQKISFSTGLAARVKTVTIHAPAALQGDHRIVWHVLALHKF